MAQEIKMPDLGTAVSEVLLLRWLKKEGDNVTRGEPLCEVETDKATTELESVAQGVILKHIAAEGDKIEAGRAIAIIGEPGEQLISPVVELKVAENDKTTDDNNKLQDSENIRISPIARNLAKKMSVDISKLVGTGTGGIITRDDVLNAKESGTLQTSNAPQTQTSLSRNQLAVARTITASWKEVVPITLFGKINMTAASSLRKKMHEQGTKISFDSIIVHTLATTMRQFPKLRGYWSNESIAVSDHINIGLAVSVEDDLYIPVIKDADKKTAVHIDTEIRTLASKATQQKLTHDDLIGATMTISNLGMFPVDAFTAIIPPKQCGVISIGTIDDVVMSRDASIVFEKFCTFSLTVDHRFINGRYAAQVLAHLKQAVENI